MDEKQYDEIARTTLRRVLDLFDDIDIDDADVESSGDVVRIKYGDGSHCVVNTQRPAKQLWLAGGGKGWHFDYEPGSQTWVDDKGSGNELFAVLASVSAAGGVQLDV